MKKTALVIGIIGSLAQLGILSNESAFEPASPPTAAIVLAITGLVGALVVLKKQKLGGTVMLLSGIFSAIVMIMTVLNTAPPAAPGMLPTVMVLSSSGNLFLGVAGILALVARKTKPAAAR